MKKNAGMVVGKRQTLEDRPLKMLSRLGRLKTTSKFSFDWCSFFWYACLKKLLGDDYIHAGDIFSLVARIFFFAAVSRANV